MNATHYLHTHVELTRLTDGPGHYFFGYYDKSPWDANGGRLLGMKASFLDRPPRADDVLDLVIREEDDTTRTFAQTTAWNWQQGCMLQWLAGGREGLVIYNDQENGQFVSRIHDLRTGKHRTLPKPVYAVDPAGQLAVTTSFSRLQHQRPGYGYPGVDDPWRDIPAPEEDGIFSLDLKSGETRLLVSLAQIASFAPSPDFVGRLHRFNHLQFSRDGSRFVFLHRFKKAGEPVGITRMFTVGRDGAELRLLTDHGMVSHFDWHQSDALIAWALQREIGERFFRFSDRGEPTETIGDKILDCDGHCSVSPDGRWLLTDTYPDSENFRTLLLFRFADGLRIELGKFYSPPVDWEIRCDLHPRWSPDGRNICIDSAHEGGRHMYTLSIEKLLHLFSAE